MIIPEWTYNGDVYIPGPDDCSFVYKITRLDTGRQYIGKKSLFNKITRPPLKGQTRKRKSKIESDWRSYWGSSEELLNDILSLGCSMFRREILHICFSKGEASYLETREIFINDCLLNGDMWYNSWVSTRIRKSHIKRLITS